MGKNKEKFTVGGLFSGVGGIEKGFRNAGFYPLWLTDYDKYSYETYIKNNPKSKKEYIGPIDINELLQNKNNLKKLQPIDVLAAGFPCQPFSLAGNRNGLFECPHCRIYPLKKIKDMWICEDINCDFETELDYTKIDDSRGNTFFKIMEIVDFFDKEHKKKPRVLFLENVKNLRNHDGGKTIKIIEDEIRKRGYSFTINSFNTMEHTEIPQNRERVFMVCFENESDIYSKESNQLEMFDDDSSITSKFLKSIPKKIKKLNKINDYLDDDVDEKYFYDDSFMNGNKEHYQTLIDTITEQNTAYQWRRVYLRENKNKVIPTLVASMGQGGHNVPLILTKKNKIRKLTPKECFKFQGFKDFKIPELSDSALYKQVGNTVTIPLVQKIASSIKKALESS